MIEMIKYLDKPDRSNEDYSSSYINLANNLILQSEPIKPKIQIINGNEYTEWGCINSNIKLKSCKSLTIRQFIDYWGQHFSTIITMIVADSKILYMYNKLNNLDKQIEQLIDISKINILSICSNDNELPDIMIY